MPRTTLISTLLFCILFIFGNAVAQTPDFSKGGWDEIPEEELAATTPKVDPNAHSEFTYRKIRVSDTERRITNYRYHYRVKLFSEGALEDWDKVDIVYFEGARVRDVKARVIYPDLTIAELKSSDIVKRKIYEADGFKGYARSFSFPGLRPGCIIEYRWKMTVDSYFKGVSIDLLEEQPTWIYDVEVKPYRSMASSVRSYNSGVAWEKISGGYRLSLSDLKAKSDKPFLGPRRDFEPFVILEYSSKLAALEQEKYWNYRAGRLSEVNDSLIKPKLGRVKKLAAEIFDGIQFNEEKIQAAYDYCTTEIVNISEPTTVYTEEEIEELDWNDSPYDTLKGGYGRALDINAVFGSLVAAAGFEVSLAEVEDRGISTYHPGKLGGFNLSDWAVAVKVNGSYKYYDPGSAFLDCGELNAENVGGHTILLVGKKLFDHQETPDVKNDHSKMLRIATLEMDEYGDLEGEIVFQYSGHAGLEMKRALAGQSETEKEDYILERYWKDRLPRTEIEELELHGDDTRGQPLVVIYKVKIPGYADVAGDRILFNPSIFQEGGRPVFADETRTEPVRFPYRHYVQDKVTFKIPDGYLHESSEGVPDTYDGPLLVRKSMIAEEEQGTLVYQRLHTLKHTAISGEYYGVVKREFDLMNEIDDRPVSIVMNPEYALGGEG